MMAQCILSRDNGDILIPTKTTMTAWLDDSKIKEGCFITLKGKPEVWRVDTMSAIRLSNDYINERSQDYKKTRQASDI
jgi:hypothetical protein